MRLLFACEHLYATGGMLRLERTGTALEKLGHSCAYLPFASNAVSEFRSRFPVLTFSEAASSTWDAVLVPGAGFHDAVISEFARLRDERFGVRIQLILNDQHVRPAFLRVNRSFNPDLVIFNSESWQPGSYREFSAKQFHHLIGAVNTELFRPRERTDKRSAFVIGAQISKNPVPLVEAVASLPAEFKLRFFGFDRSFAFGQAKALLGERAEYVGPLMDDDLAAYFGDLDVIVSTEEQAGWANVAAEAMASGVPVVTTTAGTLSIARQYETAIVLDKAEPAALAAAILELKRDPLLARELAANARRRIERFDWSIYSGRLADLLMQFDGSSHYTHDPSLGLFGKATIEERIHGLDRLLASAPKFRTILDVGAAEGMLADKFLQRGAARVDAWEYEPSRVATGTRLFGSRAGLNLQRADLNSDTDLRKIEQSAPEEGYELTLYLGVHQHLAAAQRIETLSRLLAITSGQFALRTPLAIESRDQLTSQIEAAGFELEYAVEPDEQSFAGPLYVFERTRR